MTFPHRLQFVLFLICCMQDVLASNSTNSTNTTATPSSSVFTAPNVTFSIDTKYSSPDCASCSNGGTITMTMSCSIKMPSNNNKKCDRDELSATSCDYVTFKDKVYRCADLEKNFTSYEKEYFKPVKQCDDVCPASGSVLSAHLVFIFSSGLAVGLLSQTL
ncbi:unnamed protein product [Pocillopora meandrina]|uniref:Uncharacterized protein n=1 Tax=Pocillopora meandrina TaxID=46732 RepID=A0AAU9X2L1_9CNID|nr:unnamed protein product [Pocillopora meandrina]